VQTANRETVGVGSDGALIPNHLGITDWCDRLTWSFDFDGTAKNCLPESVDATPAHNRLLFWAADEDWDGTHGALRSLWDYRDGAALHVDMSASDCGPCQLQAQFYQSANEPKYRARGSRSITILEAHINNPEAYTDERSCHNGIVAWRTNYNIHGPIICDRDMDGDGLGDFAEQQNVGAGIAFPTNWYLDHNWVVWRKTVGLDSGLGTSLAAKAYPEWCE